MLFMDKHCKMIQKPKDNAVVADIQALVPGGGAMFDTCRGSKLSAHKVFC